MGSRQYGIDNDRLVEYAKEIKKSSRCRRRISNSNRRRKYFPWSSRSKPKVWIECKDDYMGMLATVINGMALQGALEDQGIKTRLQSAMGNGQSS